MKGTLHERLDGVRNDHVSAAYEIPTLKNEHKCSTAGLVLPGSLIVRMPVRLGETKLMNGYFERQPWRGIVCLTQIKRQPAQSNVHHLLGGEPGSWPS